MGEVAHHAGDAGKHFEGGADVVGFDMGDGGGEFMQAELEPDFGGLVDDDEEHFFVAVGAGVLAFEQVVEVEIGAVAEGFF